MAIHKAEYGNKVFTGVGRCIYPHIDQVDTSKFGGNKYNIIFLQPKAEAKASLAKLREEAVAVFKKAFPDIPTNDPNIDWPWRDGDKVADKRTGYEGMYYLKAVAYPTKKDGTKLDPPQAIGPDGRSKINPSAIYGGCFVRVCVTPKSYEVTETKTFVMPDGSQKDKTVTVHGISLILNGVQFVGDGDRLGASRDVTFEVAPGYQAGTAVASPTSDDRADMPF